MAEIARQPHQRFIANRLLAPLAMEDSHLGPPPTLLARVAAVERAPTYLLPALFASASRSAASRSGFSNSSHARSCTLITGFFARCGRSPRIAPCPLCRSSWAVLAGVVMLIPSPLLMKASVT